MKQKINTYFKENSEYKGPKGKFWKFWSLMTVILIGFVMVVVRLFTIKIINNDKYKRLQRERTNQKLI